jgi:hypothetical protein
MALDKQDKSVYLQLAVEIAKQTASATPATSNINTAAHLAIVIQETYNKMIEIAENF